MLNLLFKQKQKLIVDHQYIIKMNLLPTFIVALLTYVTLATQSAVPRAYGCDVVNCQACSGPNFCGLCDTNYILMVNQETSAPYCAPVSCTLANCTQCYQSNICSVCEPNFYLTSNSTCVANSNMQSQTVTCSSNCLSCVNSTYCNVCSYGYNIQNNACAPNNGALIANCMAAFTGFSCQVCNSGYMVNPGYQCTLTNDITCNLADCQYCEASDQCTECSYGFQVNETTDSCESLECDVTNCAQCDTSSEALCSACKSSYYLTDDNTCIPQYYGCNIQNCVTCAESAEVCSLCSEGYYPAGQTCVLLTASVPNQLNTSSIFYYPVTNCKTFGTPIPGTSILQIGCKTCNDYFLNIAGYCVANLTQGNYTCNIENCAYCSQNNYCAQCVDGYVVYLGYYNKCIKMYSPAQFCQLTGLFTTGCSICNAGYIQNGEGQCVNYWPSSNCAVTGCDYCLENNVCSVCRSGYTLNGTVCNADCDIENCYTCDSATECETCNQNYTLVNDSTMCNLTSGQTQSNCSTYGDECTACNILQCTACSSGFTLSNGVCCDTPAQDVYGCAVYENACSNICIQCQIGFNILTIPYFNFSTQCINVNCMISNCAYCYASPNTCIVCMQNFTVASNGSCVAYTPAATCLLENCQSCNSNGTCNTCLSGYHLFNGACVCPFQNCLKCMSSSYCSICAYPMVTGVPNTPGCLPEVVPLSNCQIPNCVQCQNTKNCAVCSEGFSLASNGSCIQNLCDSGSNCALCSSNNQFCFLCKNGTYQSTLFNKTCSAIPADYACFVEGCAICQTSTTCMKCYDMFYLAPDSSCKETVCSANCLICYANNTCSICRNGYYRTLVNGDLQCNAINNSTAVSNCSGIDYCVACTANTLGASLCNSCLPGFMPSTNQSLCIPQVCEVKYCQACMPSSMKVCLACQQGYYLNPYYLCVPFNPVLATSTCNIYNCMFCGANNTCAKCLLGWNTTSTGHCVTEEFCNVSNCGNCTSPSVCYSCAAQFEFTSTNVCSPSCTIENCITCSSLTECSICDGDLIVSQNNTACQCPPTYTSTGNTTCGCPDDFTESGDTCFNCSTPGNCSICTSDNTCGVCSDLTFKLVDGNCECPDDTFTFLNDSCACLNKTTRSDDTCIGCDVDNCIQCNSIDNCILCEGNLTALNATNCGCYDDFNQTDDNTCICSGIDQLPSQDKSQCFVCDMGNCLYCSADNVCAQCVNNLTLNSNGSECQCTTDQSLYNSYCYTCNSSALYCSVCNATNLCYTCQDTFTNVNGTCSCATSYTLFESQCVQCNIANCTSCQTANQCSSCVSEYTLFSTTACISCTLNNCSACSSPNYCKSCSNGLVISSHGACVTCSVNNCQTCSKNNVCGACKSGYVFGVNGNTCVNCSVTGCSVCSQDNNCSSCLKGYYYNSVNQTCSICSYPCASCNSNGGCLTCQSPYSSNAATNGSCYGCTNQNCATCPSSNTAICSTCATTYTINSSSLCTYQCKSIYCTACQFNSVCTACSAGYSPNGTTGCNKCAGAPACIQCSTTDLNTCYQCSSGYYAQGGQCYKCPQSYCKTCNSQQCLTYQESTGFVALTINNVVYPAVCDPNCAVCSSNNPSVCQTCQAGYSYSNGICIACNSNCKTCSSSNSNTCLTCYGNANLVSGNCVLCTGNCLTCLSTSSGSCTSCPNNFFLTTGGSNTCTKGCPALCQTCSSATFCTTCQSGYTATSNGTCLPCLSSCRSCSGTAPGLCLSCGTGFFLNGNACQACTGNCTSCNYAGCTTCATGFTLTSTFTCTQTCLPPCSACSTTNPSICSSCILGYTFNQNTGNCDPTPACSGGVCYFCPFGYSLLNNNCEQCAVGSNCARCSVTNLTQCTSCMSGLYVNSNGTCSTCASSCATCSSSAGCLTCAIGYVAPVQTIQSSTQCIACIAPCQTCMNTPETCSSCVDGFALTGWKCLSTYNFGWTIELESTLTNFYNNYNAFLLVLSNIYGSSNVGLISMSEIYEGSVNAAGNITITSDSNTQDGYQNLNTALTNGSTIAGMQILSSSVSVNGGDTPGGNGGANLALILGICIPVAVILIGILVYFLCIRKKNNVPPVNYSANNGNPNTTVRQTFELTRDEPAM